MTTPANSDKLGFDKLPIRDLGLKIEGTRLAPLVEKFKEELRQAGVVAVRPNFYLSTDWGVPFPSVSIGIPFYLARPELLAMHTNLVGHVEGLHDADILRYFRHEMGHVMNYAYKLYEREEWVAQFGSMTQPYVEEYRPEPFSTDFVLHLPGFYAQKHPDEDWAETFAVWMTPGINWRDVYAAWPVVIEKLDYCDSVMAEVGAIPPLLSTIDDDESVSSLPQTVEEYYQASTLDSEDLPVGLDGALRTMFDDFEPSTASKSTQAASQLMRRMEQRLMASVFRWTGHFPERTRELLRYLADRADKLLQVYDPARESEVGLEIAVLVTSLAATYVRQGSYLACSESAEEQADPSDKIEIPSRGT